MKSRLYDCNVKRGKMRCKRWQMARQKLSDCDVKDAFLQIKAMIDKMMKK